MVVTLAESVDAIVVGAGPAGTNAAIRTASAGLKTIIFEEHQEVGVPVQCGEGVSKRLLEYHKIDYKNADFVDIHLPSQKFFFSGKNESGDWDMQKYMMLSGYQTFLLNRTKFDQSFAKDAMAKGAEIRTSSKVSNLIIDNHGVEATVRSVSGSAPYTVKAKVVVAADGPAARIGKQNGLSVPSKYVHAVEWVVDGKWTDSLDFYFDHDLTPYGYSWVFPKKDYSKIGLCCRQVYEPAPRLEKLMERFEKRFGTTFKKRHLIGGLIPAEEKLPEKTYGNRLLVVGDAGGFTNPFFYGGISVAVLTGRLAGDTIAKVAEKDSDFGEEKLSRFQDKWRREPSFNPVIYEGRNLFYKEFTQENLEVMGNFAQFEKVGKVTGIPWIREQILTAKAFLDHDIRKNWRKYKKVVAGMSISGQWGF